MAEMMSFPFRLVASGRVATVEQSSEQGHGEQIVHLIGTRPYERPLVPFYGVPDPAFESLSPGAVAAGVNLYGPPVRIRAVTITAEPNARASSRAEVAFDV